MSPARAAAILVLCTAAVAAAKDKPKPRAAAPAAPPRPTVTVVGVRVTGEPLGGENDQIRGLGRGKGTQVVLAVTVPAPAGIIALSGDAETLEMAAGAAFESPQYEWSPTVAPDGTGASIELSSEELPAAGATAVTASGTLKAVVSGGFAAEKVPNLKLEADVPLKLGGAAVMLSEVKSDDDSMSLTLKGPPAAIEAIRAVRLRIGTAAAVPGQSWGSSGGSEEAEKTFRFNVKPAATGTLEADVWQAPREMDVPFRVSAGLGLPAPPAGAPAVALSRLPALPLGTASGEFTVDGTRVALAHVAAVSGPDDFDDTREAYTVYFTEKPIPAGVLEKASGLKSAGEGLAGLKVTVSQEGSHQSYRMVFTHPTLKDGVGFSSSLSGRERWLPLGPDRVSGSVKSFFDDRPTEIGGHKVQYALKFNAPVRKRFPVQAPLVLGAGATRLSAGGGEAGKAYLASQCGPLPVDVNDPKAVEAFLAKEGKLPTDEDLAQLSKEQGKPVTREDAIKLFAGILALASAFRPADCKVLGGDQDATLAVLQVEATMMGERSVAEAYLVKDGTAWTFKKHGTWKAAPKKK